MRDHILDRDGGFRVVHVEGEEESFPELEALGWSECGAGGEVGEDDAEGEAADTGICGNGLVGGCERDEWDRVGTVGEEG